MSVAMHSVLFLCTGNYYRSRFAEEIFNHLAIEKGLPWRADSRGLAPDLLNNLGSMSYHTFEALAARNICPQKAHRCPLSVSEAELRTADLVIAVKEAEHKPMMERQFGAWAGRIRYWHVHDLDQASATKAMGEIEQHVRELVDELAARTATA